MSIKEESSITRMASIVPANPHFSLLFPLSSLIIDGHSEFRSSRFLLPRERSLGDTPGMSLKVERWWRLAGPLINGSAHSSTRRGRCPICHKEDKEKAAGSRLSWPDFFFRQGETILWEKEEKRLCWRGSRWKGGRASSPRAETSLIFLFFSFYVLIASLSPSRFNSDPLFSPISGHSSSAVEATWCPSQSRAARYPSYSPGGTITLRAIWGDLVSDDMIRHFFVSVSLVS